MHKQAVFYSQGVALRADHNLPFKGAPCVILSHGLEGDKDGAKWKLLSERLYDSGFASLRFNYHGCGEGTEKSDGDFEDSFLSRRILDFKAALDYAEELDIDNRRLGAIGSSLGGTVIIASGDARIRAMVSLATPYSFKKPAEDYPDLNKGTGLVDLPSGRKIKSTFFHEIREFDAGKALSNLDYPLMVIHGSADQVVPVEDGQKIYQKARGCKELKIIKNGNHSFDDPVHLAQIVDLSCRWLKKHL